MRSLFLPASGSALALSGALLLTAGCTPTEGGAAPGETEAALLSTNGLTSINGLTSTNGLSGNGLSGNGLSGNGLSGNGLSGNGLSGNGLSGNGLILSALSSAGLTPTSYLMNSAAGRSTVSYLVRCALPGNQSLTKTDQNGTSYTFPGEIGVAPQWQSGTCTSDCQIQMTGCMLAHVNTSGQHINLWLDGDSTAIGWSQSADFPYQEGSFFGNIFVSPPTAYYCNGKDFDLGVVPGRLGVGQPGAPYVDPLTTPGGYCKDVCTPADYPNSADGYKACYGFNHIVTVWRNFDPNTVYKLCNRLSGKCVQVQNASTTNGAKLIQSTASSGPEQGWKIIQRAPKQYKFVNANSGQCVDVAGGSTADKTALQQWTCAGASALNQLWSFTPTGDGYYQVSPASDPAGAMSLPGNSTADGALLEQDAWNGGTSQIWSIKPAS